MKFYLKKKTLLSLFITTIGYSQTSTPEIKSQLPEIISPSPTVSALMKFEEVPVSNYTGIPNISIPLFSSGTLSKDMNVNISLNYHAGVGANDVAGELGLGWSLLAGGTISRTVRGLPDEQLILDGDHNSGKVGLYHTSLANHNNYYYQHGDNFSQFVYQNSFEANQYLWDITEFGKFDTEHDLWQFNFFGNSGRFYIKKDLATNQLSLQPLDDYRVKVINNYTTVGINNFIPTGFTVYDEKGYKYIFDAAESTINKQAVTNTYKINETTSVSAEKEFPSAFHLSKVYDNNNNLLVEYIFSQTNDYKECTTNSSYTYNDYSETVVGPQNALELMSKYNCFYEFKPIRSLVNSTSIITVRKIQSINIVNKAKIDVEYLQGREDTNISLNDKAIYVDKLIVKNWNNEIVKKYSFEYDYSAVLNKRMILTAVNELSRNSQFNNKYELFYKTNDSSGYDIGKDAWGYFNLKPSCSSLDVNFSKETSPSFSTTDVLQKIKYPTGGCSVFNFEANTYSFIGDEGLTNYDENKSNYHQTYYSPNPSIFNASYTIYSIPVASVQRDVKFFPSIILEDESTAHDSFHLEKFNGTTWDPVTTLICSLSNANCCIDASLEPNKQYRIKRNFLSNDTVPNATIEIQYFEKNTVLNEFLYGGGNRIKQIGYFEEDVPANYYDDISLQSIYSPKKEKKYSYTQPGNVNKSSGSLTFFKPLLKYNSTVSLDTHCGEPPYYSTQPLQAAIMFVSYTSFNNLNVIKTQGADVGYKHVKITETGNGYTKFEYTSPIDYPEEMLFTNLPPFLPSKNLDYKRGLPLRETIYREDHKILQEVTSGYDFVNYEVKYGNRIHKPDGAGFGPASIFHDYGNYLDHVDNPQGSISCADCGDNFFSDYNLSGYPVNYLGTYPLVQAYGWAKLMNKNTKEYFYPNGSSIPDIVETNQTFTYNPVNKQIASATTTNSTGDILKTEYSYHTGNSIYSQNRISEIEKIDNFKNGQLLSSSKVNYSNTFTNNASFLPQMIVTAKGSQSLENRLLYNQYDEFSNPIEMQQESGIKIVYVWGYNKTQPIAKIENATYAQVEPYISNLQTLSNTGTESDLITALNTLRTNLPNAMVTTYTYIPLVGVSTITDPKGNRTTYEYDSFNRLKQVKDHDGKVLSENEYHYKN